MIVAALKQEVEGLSNQILLTGVGKINATKVLTDYIIKNKPKHIINYGTAAKVSTKVEVGKIYEVRKFIQRDMDARPIGWELGKTPYDETPKILDFKSDLSNDKNIVCGTGDNFCSNR